MGPLEAALRETLRELVRDAVREALAEMCPPEKAHGDIEYMTATQVSELLGVSVETLKQWRSRAEGPPFIRVARRSVRYSATDVHDWMDAGLRGARKGGT